MKLNIKKTIWEEIKLPDDLTKQEVIDAIKNQSADYIAQNIDFGDVECMDIMDTGEYIEPYENGGQPTIELLDDKGKRIWDNGREEG
jgi:hypothetical protein